jgi:GTP pyrophosphokinase
MQGLDHLSKELSDRINAQLTRIGVLYRIFWRNKEDESIDEKISRKKYDSSRLLQDVIGIRVNLYFVDDLSIVTKMIKNTFELNNEEIDRYDEETFKPTRTNLIFNIPKENLKDISELINIYNKPIDKTFEIQIRTVMSEGWHEVEHDLRYKCKKDWDNHSDLSRTLNGIYASLETGEWTILKIFGELCYRNYKDKEWQAMIRNKFRLRFQHSNLRQEIIDLLNRDNDTAKEIFRIDRNHFIDKIASSNCIFPINYDNIIYAVNSLITKNNDINRLTPELLKKEFKKLII